MEFALKNRYVKLVETGLEVGEPGLKCHHEKRFHPTMELCRRIYPHIHNMDGFFVCKLRKYANALPTPTAGAAATANEEGDPLKGAKTGSASTAAAGGKPVKKKIPKTADPNKSAGPLPKPGAERPGGGTHGDGEAKKQKRMLAVQRMSQRGPKAKRQRKS